MNSNKNFDMTFKIEILHVRYYYKQVREWTINVLLASLLVASTLHNSFMLASIVLNEPMKKTLQPPTDCFNKWLCKHQFCICDVYKTVKENLNWR